MKKKPHLRSVISGLPLDFQALEDFHENGESLEVVIPGIEEAKLRAGDFLWQRFAEFLPFDSSNMNFQDSLGVGNTPLIPANKSLQKFVGLPNLLLKNETANPTWSFKDRGSLASIFMARQMKEKALATISTGNMGNSVAAYAAQAGLSAYIFIPEFTPDEKILAMAIHGAHIIRVRAKEYSDLKNAVLQTGLQHGLRIVSGNGPIRTEGYKLTSFELFEQLKGKLPDCIAVPTSACGHIRGLFKGFQELKAAGLIAKLPRMIIVQAANNSPIVDAFNQGRKEIIPFSNFHTIAEAISAGNPSGGNDLLQMGRENNWLAANAAEHEILEAQKILARAGFFVEASSAVSVIAIRKLINEGKISADASVIIMLTGSGLKHTEVARMHPIKVQDLAISDLAGKMEQISKDIQ